METNNNNLEEDFKTGQYYKDKIDELTVRLYLLLDELKLSYASSRNNPGNIEIQERYRRSVSSIEQIESEIFKISNDMQVGINNINELLLNIDSSIKQEKNNNVDLNRQLEQAFDQTNSSSEMITNYKDIYNTKYLRNWALLLGILAGIVTINMIYKKPIV